MQTLMTVMMSLAVALGVAPVGSVTPAAAQTRPAGWTFAGAFRSYQAACRKAQCLEQQGYEVMVKKQGNAWCVYCR